MYNGKIPHSTKCYYLQMQTMVIIIFCRWEYELINEWFGGYLIREKCFFLLYNLPFHTCSQSTFFSGILPGMDWEFFHSGVWARWEPNLLNYEGRKLCRIRCVVLERNRCVGVSWFSHQFLKIPVYISDGVLTTLESL